MTFDTLHSSNHHLLLKCVSGSRAYGLHTPSSDTDIKGVFVLPYHQFYGLVYTAQAANPSNDIVYYELKRFIELLAANNPNLLELLNSPSDCTIYRHPLMDRIKPELFLSKLCKASFAGYAISQVKKARGLNKKIVNPVEQQRKNVAAFCYVSNGAGSLPLHKWLEINQFRQEDCGLSALNHFRGTYALFHKTQAGGFVPGGIFSGDEANDVRLSPIPQGLAPLAYLTFNKDGYSTYCKDYKEYWEWVQARNENRYQATLEHGKNYDAKNMMHTFRLLNMAAEIANYGQVIVRRHDREFLMKVRSGFYEYDSLVAMANEKIAVIDELYEKSGLPEMPNTKGIEDLLVEMREEWYKNG